jgi:aminopeptidase N
MPGRRLAAALAILAMTATACEGPSRSDRRSPQPSASTSAAGPAPAPAVPSYSGGQSQPVADPVYPNLGNPAIDVLHYQLALRWAPSTRTLSGTATLAIRATRDIDEIRLDFARPLRTDSVTVDGKAATATHRGNDLIVGAGQRLTRDARVVVAIRYHGRPRALVAPMVRKDIGTVGINVRPDGSVFALQEPYGALTWYPVNDQPSDEALYDVALTVPRGWAGVSNGVLRGTSRSGDKVTFSWHAADPIASYLVALGIDRYQKHTATGPHGIPVSYWIRPQDRARALPVLRKTPRMLAWLEKRFGRYPFASAGVFAIREDTGMETQTMVTLGRDVPAEALLHELAHQWFGDSVGPRTWRAIWLNEGFATYIQFLLYDIEVLGQSQTRMLAGMRQLDGQLRRQHGPPGHYKPDHFASSNVYFPPALMLHEIRKTIGDKKFFAMMRDWAQQHRNVEVDRAVFTSWLNRYTGRNLTPLVNRWLDSPTTPTATGG